MADKSFGDYYTSALYQGALLPNRFLAAVTPGGKTAEAMTAEGLQAGGDALSKLMRGVSRVPGIKTLAPGVVTAASAFDPNSNLSPLERARNASIGVGGTLGPGKAASMFTKNLVKPITTFGKGISNLVTQGVAYGSVAPVLNAITPFNYGQPAYTPPSTQAAPAGNITATQAYELARAASSKGDITGAYKLFLQAAAGFKDSGANIPAGFEQYGTDINRAYGVNAGITPVITPGNSRLTPAQIAYFAQQRSNVGAASGQAAARDALQEKQARADLSRQLAAINSYMSAAPQDVATTTAALGPAAELGYERTLEREGGAQIAQNKQTLKDFLEQQKLSAKQRSASTGRALSEIEKAKALQEEEAAAQAASQLFKNLKIGG